MTKPRQILEGAYQKATLDRIVNLSEIQQKWVETIVEEAESQKAVLAVLITSLVKKIETPIQDIRFHKVELTNGYSGRTFDTNFITPFIREKFPRFAMKSGHVSENSLHFGGRGHPPVYGGNRGGEKEVKEGKEGKPPFPPFLPFLPFLIVN